ncbi:MAG: hypothetical protein JO040_06170 [Gemmatimonadetes bacterium]|nr:hypothetical protein [Gemmatimonadota bacterium]
MISHATARARAYETINRPDPYWPDRPEMVILDRLTIEKPYGWVFFYDSARYLETGSISDALAGNAPVLVTADRGEVHVIGTAHSVEHYLQAFERTGSVHLQPRR